MAFLMSNLSSSSWEERTRVDFSLDGSPCDTEVRLGRYAKDIAAEFPLLPDGSPTIRHAGRRQNLFCTCYTSNWMTCMIAALTPIQENIVEERIGIRDFSRLRPFWFLELPDRDTSPLVYVRPCNGHHLVFAEIMVLNRGYAPTPSGREPPIVPWPHLEQMNFALHPPAIQRTNSAPSMMSHPQKSMDIKLCRDEKGKAVCPVKQEPFHIKQIVYILKQDEEKVAQGRHVACISAEGLTRLSRIGESRQNGGFLDPLKRVPGILTISNDFTAYLLDDIESCANAGVISVEAGSSSNDDRLSSPLSTRDHFKLFTLIIIIGIIFGFLTCLFFPFLHSDPQNSLTFDHYFIIPHEV